MNLINARVLLLSVFMFFSLMGFSFAECDGFHKLNQEGSVSLGGYAIKLVDVSQTYPYPATVEVSYNGMFVTMLEVKASVGYPQNVETFSAAGGQVMKIEVCKTEVPTEDSPQTVKTAYVKLTYGGESTGGGGQAEELPETGEEVELPETPEPQETEEVAVPTQEPAQTVELIQKQAVKCMVDENLMKSLDELMLKLKHAQEEGDTQAQAMILEDISQAKKKINNAQQACASNAGGGGGSSATATVAAETSDSCAELVKWQEKKKYYEDVSNSKKKDTYDEKDLAKTLSELDKGIEKLQKKCLSEKKRAEEPKKTGSVLGKIAFWWGKVNQHLQSGGAWTTDPDGVSGANLDPIAYCQKWYPSAKGVAAGNWELIDHWKDAGNLKDYGNAEVKHMVYYCIDEEGDYTGVATTSETMAPVAPTEAVEVSNYYREKITSIMGQAQDVEVQISSLKQLRMEIDSLVSRLIEKQNNIKMSEMQNLIDKIEVSPDKIKTGDVELGNVKDKIFETNIGDAQVEVTSGENNVMLSQGEIEVQAPNVVLTKEGISIGDKKVKISPQKVVETVKSMPTSMSLSEEDGQAVYVANTEKQAKLFGILPVKVQNRIKVSAENGEVLSEEKPFWAGLTTSSE
ncbi:hypothetical protein AUJ17_05180 [Candidatus Micrarchaeota archaeon CG1_02_47_40]|nr:MAG: hypothetical protein AUJ17_05180 [Candidatus Micrarchaeota archaeon CG1_02_47_40]